ncbi:MAG: type IV pilus modification PilV family protein, partial [Candidatus Omnitrophota bacterium]
MRNKNGFSLVEVIIAAVIFSLVMLGLSSVFIAGNKHTIHARERMTSAEIAK